MVPIDSADMPSSIVPKPPKPVSSVLTLPTWGIIRNFWADYFSVFGAAPYRGGDFCSVSPGFGLGVQRGRAAYKFTEYFQSGRASWLVWLR
jgi:hypothetical protein